MKNIIFILMVATQAFANSKDSLTQRPSGEAESRDFREGSQSGVQAGPQGGSFEPLEDIQIALTPPDSPDQSDSNEWEIQKAIQASLRDSRSKAFSEPKEVQSVKLPWSSFSSEELIFETSKKKKTKNQLSVSEAGDTQERLETPKVSPKSSLSPRFQIPKIGESSGVTNAGSNHAALLENILVEKPFPKGGHPEVSQDDFRIPVSYVPYSSKDPLEETNEAIRERQKPEMIIRDTETDADRAMRAANGLSHEENPFLSSLGSHASQEETEVQLAIRLSMEEQRPHSSKEDEDYTRALSESIALQNSLHAVNERSIEQVLSSMHGDPLKDPRVSGAFFEKMKELNRQEELDDPQILETNKWERLLVEVYLEKKEIPSEFLDLVRDYIQLNVSPLQLSEAYKEWNTNCEEKKRLRQIELEKKLDEIFKDEASEVSLGKPRKTLPHESQQTVRKSGKRRTKNL